MDKLGYPELSDRLFKDFADILFRESGMTLKEHKKYLLMHRLSKWVGEGRKYPTYEAYHDALVNDKSGNRMVEFVNVLTTNFSYFFREEIHFDFLKQLLAEKVGTNEPIRIWSAACSTGEEPYSIAISAIRSNLGLEHKDFKILATDISTRVLEIASAGRYHYTRVRGHLEDSELRMFFHFDREANVFTVRDNVKKLISFRYLNLMEPYPFQKLFDVVFLRNVLIYFDNREKEVVIEKISEYIKPGGYLILGLSESLVGVKNPLISLRNSIYQKKL